MTTKWNPNAISKNTANADLSELFKDEFAVILLQGKNLFGDKIYSYLKVGMGQIKELYAALQSGKDFTPSDFGTVVAAGKGDPPEDVKAEIATTYKMLEPIKPATFGGTEESAPAEKKNWDEC
ncbi:MAG: hypothetical protein KGJ06_07160 [Pseudomonadota bacterium]|nr:hypothetical protein [Pseudomonadota bacterium]